MPYGLEQVINTNGTLLDYTHGPNIGVKGDWGFSLNGSPPGFEYELALTRGSGNEWVSEGNPGILAGRIGTRRDRNLALGLSFLDGDVHQPATPGEPLARTRLGLDAHWYWRRLELLGEISVGRDEGNDVVNGLVEVNTRSVDLSWFLYGQLRRFQTSLPDGTEVASTLALGIQFEPDNRWDLSAEYAQDLETRGAAPSRSMLRAQLRYRFH